MSFGRSAAIGVFGLMVLAAISHNNEPSAPEVPSCKSDWTLCTDNSDMANNWHGWTHVQAACEIAAEKSAKYGTPEWPWLAFSSFLKGDDYPKTGIVKAMEDEAKFKNMFNASVKSKVICTYNINTETVTDIQVRGL